MPHPPVRIGRLYAALLLVSLLSALDQTIVASSLPTVTGELGGLEHMAWIITAYTLAMTFAMPIFGQLSDVIGRRPLFLIALVIFLVGSTACGFAQDMLQLASARVLQGIGGAGLGILSQAIIADAVPPRDRAKYLGPLGSVFGIATVVGPIVGGLLTDTVGWRWIFWINLPLGLIALALAAATIPRVDTATLGRARFDSVGAGLLVLATTGITLIATWGGLLYGWTSPIMITVIATTLLAAAAFILVELRVEHPLVPLGIFRNRVVLMGTGLALVVGAGLFSAVGYFPTYVQMVYNTSSTVAGIVLLAMVIGIMISAIGTGFLISHSGHYRVYPIVGTVIASGGMLGLAFATPATPLAVVALMIGIVGLGAGAFMQVSILVVQNATSHTILGAVTSTVSLVRELGVTVGTALVGGVFAARLIDLLRNAILPDSISAESLTPEVLRASGVSVQAEVALAYVSAMSPVFAVLAGIFAIGFVLALFLPQLELSTSMGRGRAVPGDSPDAGRAGESRLRSDDGGS